MKVYELIQALAQYESDTEVVFHVNADLDLDVEAEFDRSKEDDTQEVTVTAKIDEEFDYDDIQDNERRSWNKNITINLVY